MPLTAPDNRTSSGVLSFEDVSFSYGLTPAVEHITFTVDRGEFVALIGPNGSGKSTLVKLALGLERPQHGRVTLFGQPVKDFRDWRRIGYVPQYVSAFSTRFPITVAEVVAHGRYRGLDPAALFRRSVLPEVEQALRQVDIWDLRSQLVSELSGGQQRRVLIARALVNAPEVLFLDEPTSGLDTTTQTQFYNLLGDLRQRKGTTIILVSHDLGVVLHEATRVACINHKLYSYLPTHEVTESELTAVYGTTMDVVVHRHT
jgi:zinc transport system ATP-binding protein